MLNSLLTSLWDGLNVGMKSWIQFEMYPSWKWYNSEVTEIETVHIKALHDDGRSILIFVTGSTNFVKHSSFVKITIS